MTPSMPPEKVAAGKGTIKDAETQLEEREKEAKLINDETACFGAAWFNMSSCSS